MDQVEDLASLPVLPWIAEQLLGHGVGVLELAARSKDGHRADGLLDELAPPAEVPLGGDAAPLVVQPHARHRAARPTERVRCNGVWEGAET